MRILLLAAALCAALATSAAAADPVTAAATIDRPTITAGDRVVLSVTVEAAPGHRITDPGIAPALAGVEVLEILPAQQSRLGNGGTRLLFRYHVTAYTVGEVAIPPIDVAFTDAAGASGVVRTAPLAFRVESVILPEEDASDIKPLKPQLVIGTSLAAELQRLAPFVAAAALAGAVALVVLYRRRRRAAGAVDGLTPAERALAELERIASLDLPAKGRFAEHYELLAAALRRYVAERYGLPARERTPRELRAEMERAGIDPQQRAAIFEVLAEGEIVRFHGERTYPAHARNALSSALNALNRAAASDRLALAEVASDR